MEGGWKSAGYDNGLTVRKNSSFLHHRNTETMFLPRQARDKGGKN
eukprot:COSAG06_NODE_1306_length_9917_cov_12.542167_4_plen_45_part_00